MTHSTRHEPGQDGIPVSPRLLRSNMRLLTTGHVVGGAVGFVAQATMARTLGGRTYGVYIAAFAIARVVSMLNEIGSTDHLVREAALDRSWLTRRVGDLLLVKAVVGFVVITVATGAAALLAMGSEGLAVTAMLALMISADRTSDVFRSGLQAIERLDLTTAITVSISVLSAGGIIGALALGWGLTGAVAVSMFVSIAAIPVSYLVLRRHVPLRLRATAGAARRLARESSAYAVVGFLMFGIAYADTLIVRGYLGEFATGLYGAAYRIIVVISFIAMAFDRAVFRSMTHLAARSRDAFISFVNSAAAGLFAVALPFAVGGAIVGDRVLVLVFGGDFTDGGDALRILLLSLVFSFPRVPMLLALIVDGRVRTASWIVGLGFLVNVSVNLVLVPMYGIAAAAWVDVFTEALVTLATWITLTRHAVPMTWLRTARPALVAVAIMAVPVTLTRDAPLVLPIALGAVIYIGVSAKWLLPALMWRPAHPDHLATSGGS